MRKDRWKFIKNHGLCYCCLLVRHNRNVCPVPVCDVNNCGLSHHRLLHWTKPNASTAEQQRQGIQPPPPQSLTACDDATVAHIASSDVAQSASEVLLKIVPVQLYGPNGIHNTYALLDDAASVSMIDSELANTLGLTSEDNYFLITPVEIRHGNRNAPYATKCRLGWSIHGYCGRTHSLTQLLLRKFSTDSDYAARYKIEMARLFENNYARELSDKELKDDFSHVWYLAHFGVQNPNKPGKLRLVFDEAGRVDNICLNDYLITGPDLYNSLFGIMLRFRENKIAIIADIKDMFLRIKVRKEDQNVCRFLWQESTDSPIKHCVMQSLIFGATCSPFIAQFIKNKNALKYEDSFPDAVKIILNNHYMDDCLYTVNNEQMAIKLVHEITSIHNSGGFEIRGWASNSKPVLENIPNDSHARSAVQFKDGATHTIYDIHGFLSPFIIKSKILLQDVHRSGVDWQCQIRPIENDRWLKWLDELKCLSALRVPRCYDNADG
ncbi:unnamed protein product [Chilo suppressalis]|uniref:Reverse transcriptase domain-containing protein n=1 Tax=Chilo suppressalis TaxID=168631 RepID=A0ABN8B687_CHISP|nr:unnamed protein product [Chilo suppressalis]